jgi:hypothetical protein
MITKHTGLPPRAGKPAWSVFYFLSATLFQNLPASGIAPSHEYRILTRIRSVVIALSTSDDPDTVHLVGSWH